MWQFMVGQIAIWAVLAVAVFAAAAANRRVGIWGLISVLAVAWPVLMVTDLFGWGPGTRQILALNSLSMLFRQLWPGATWTIGLVALPMILARRSRSRRTLIGWGLGSAAFAAFVAPFVALFAALNIPRHDPCYLPSLELEVASRTIVEVGTSGYFTDTCPVPIARELELQRDYGVVRMMWWGSPHRLYMVGEGSGGTPLAFGGERVEEYHNTSGSFLAPYSGRVTFRNSNFRGVANGETFELRVSAADGELLEQLTLRYVPVRCTCATYDGP